MERLGEVQSSSPELNELFLHAALAWVQSTDVTQHAMYRFCVPWPICDPVSSWIPPTEYRTSPTGQAVGICSVRRAEPTEVGPLTAKFATARDFAVSGYDLTMPSEGSSSR